MRAKRQGIGRRACNSYIWGTSFGIDPSEVRSVMIRDGVSHCAIADHRGCWAAVLSGTAGLPEVDLRWHANDPPPRPSLGQCPPVADRNALHMATWVRSSSVDVCHNKPADHQHLPGSCSPGPWKRLDGRVALVGSPCQALVESADCYADSYFVIVPCSLITDCRRETIREGHISRR
jgi:hypothetical protein